jgi:hypothetical protein
LFFAGEAFTIIAFGCGREKKTLNNVDFLIIGYEIIVFWRSERQNLGVAQLPG